MHRRRPTLLLRALVCLAAIGAMGYFAYEQTHRGDADTNGLEGTWILLSVQHGNGTISAEHLHSHLTIAGDRFTVQDGKAGTVHIDAGTRPKAIDLVGEDVAIKALYELDGDTLRLCFDGVGADRPTAMEVRPGSTLQLLTYRRAKGR